jgi:branched-chain amino acid transport system ATP-binding protein
VLEVESLTVSYGGVRALRSISLEVAGGEIVAVIGPNGAGKSTLLWTITGIVVPSSGRIRYEGESLVGMKPETIARAGVALVPEGRHIFTTLSVQENLLLATSGRRSRIPEEALRDVFERFPVLEERLRSPAGQLSGGEAQQLAIARALLMKPRLLLLDEPSFGLGPIMVEQVFAALAALREEGATILLIEQNALQAVALADRSYVLGSGQIQRHGSRRELLEETDFVTAYFGGSQEGDGAPTPL